MNKYRIYLNNTSTVDSLDIDASYPQVMGNITLFYDENDDVVCSIPSHLVFIKL